MNIMINKDETTEAPDGLTQDQLESHFTTLAEEVFGGDITVDSLMKKEKKKEPPVYRGYNPNILDFLARAKTVEECEEIITYCLSQNDIDKKKADELRDTLKTQGPEAFGFREPGHYDNANESC